MQRYFGGMPLPGVHDCRCCHKEIHCFSGNVCFPYTLHHIHTAETTTALHWCVESYPPQMCASRLQAAVRIGQLKGSMVLFGSGRRFGEGCVCGCVPCCYHGSPRCCTQYGSHGFQKCCWCFMMRRPAQGCGRDDCPAVCFWSGCLLSSRQLSITDSTGLSHPASG